ncbi:MAG TPA: DUF6402 family protein [Luteibacter sp.]|uniref:DUF6402 family protein n=1 Tax=Luteibacter sp. TaxID=1886636 RepID=UPI002BEFC7B4|nr:DUF6402 family protein [Luteibacter sp.]HVI54922.1 DUF6402 family protein [Luteibacter sp.]
MIGSSSHQENVAAVRESIEMIPVAMRRMGWRVSAELMERWLRSPAWVLPSKWKSNNPPDPRTLASAHLDQKIVRMSWAMANPRVRIAMDELRAKMANGPARANLRDRISTLPWLSHQKMAFGSQSDSAVQLDQTCQSNRVSFGGMMDTMDDLYGGIGRATLKVALIGEATRDARTGNDSLRITHAGFYIRDTYDFSGIQYLGTWTESGVLNKSQMLMASVSDGLTFRWGKPLGHRSNQDFETLRRLTGVGGDFVLYSDVYWERVDLLLDLS